MNRETTYEVRNNKIEAWLSEHETLIAIILASTALVVLLIIGIMQPDGGPGRIKKELEKAGYNVDNIDFILVDKGDFWSDIGKIYQSSTSIEYLDGVFVDQWELKSFSFGTGIITHWSVKPYPEIPAAIPMDLRLTITQEQYEHFEEQAGGQDAEEYIKQLIDNSIRNADVQNL